MTIDIIIQKKEDSAKIESEYLEKEDYTVMDKKIKTKARIGQSFFRQSALSAYNYKCCITGLAVQKLLVASHIIPWR